MNSIPDVSSASRPNRNSKMARLVDEIRDLLCDYFVILSTIVTNDFCR